MFTFISASSKREIFVQQDRHDPDPSIRFERIHARFFLFASHKRTRSAIEVYIRFDVSEQLF